MSVDKAPDRNRAGNQPRADLKMGFVGVSTGGSSIMKVFPRWAEALGLPTRKLVGHDLPLDAAPAQYRELVAGIRDDESHLGCLVTTHKIGVYKACADLFDELDEFARLCGEISSISKRAGRLVGHAKDPVAAGVSLEEFLPAGYFGATSAEVICLGAGGAGTAASWYLARRAERPGRITCTDADAERLVHLRHVHEAGGLESSLFRYVLVDEPGISDHLVSQATPGSLVINATGLGKDRPGSPVSDGVAFPADALVWELNYRGSLEFLHHARSQERERGLTVVDGWRYFIHGWTQVIAEVFDLQLDAPTVEELADLARELR
jgi:shikimate 5-dehydrogenase